MKYNLICVANFNKENQICRFYCQTLRVTEHGKLNADPIADEHNQEIKSQLKNSSSGKGKKRLSAKKFISSGKEKKKTYCKYNILYLEVKHICLCSSH